MWSRRTPKFGPVAEGRKAGRLSSETEEGLSGEGALEVGSGQGTCGKPGGHPRSSLTRWEAGEEAAQARLGRPARSVKVGQPLGGRSWPWSPPHPPGAGLRLQCRRGPPPPRGPDPRPLSPGPDRREHHDRVLHDGADAGLRRGLLHLQPHAGRPPELPEPLRRQRLLPCRPLSPAQGGPPGPPPHPCLQCLGAPSRLPVQKPPPPGAPAPGLRPALGGLDAPPRMRLCSALRLTPALAPHPCPPGPALLGHSQPSPPGRADRQPVSPPGSSLRAPRP